MKNYTLHIIFAAVLGLFLLPGNNYACGAKTMNPGNAFSVKSKAKKAGKANRSCKVKDSKDAGKDCSGKCGHQSCKCGTACFSPALAARAEFRSGEQFPGSKDQQSIFNEAHISSGFYSVWLPPKIS